MRERVRAAEDRGGNLVTNRVKGAQEAKGGRVVRQGCGGGSVSKELLLQYTFAAQCPEMGQPF